MNQRSRGRAHRPTLPEGKAMRGRLACAFLIAFLSLFLAPINRVVAQKESKNSATPATADATKAEVAPTAAKAKTDDKTTPQATDPKTGPDGKIIIGTGV